MLDQHTINLLERLVIALEEQNRKLEKIDKSLNDIDDAIWGRT